MSDGGKGSAPRPFSVSQEEYDNRFEAIFGKKKKEFKWECPKCGVDRLKDPCPKGHTAAITGECPMVGTAQTESNQ
jgi:hypothetical protein